MTLTISEEDREIVEKLKSNNYDFRKTLNDSLEDIFSKLMENLLMKI